MEERGLTEDSANKLDSPRCVIDKSLEGKIFQGAQSC